MPFSEYFNARELGVFAEAMLAKKPAMLWNKLFPAQSIPSMDLNWIKARTSNVQLLRTASLGEKAARRSPVGFQSILSELPFFREAMVVDEKQRQDITNMLILYRDKPELVEQILQNLFEEHAQLVLGAHADCDFMVGSLLTSGKIELASDINAGRTNNYSYDYDVDGTWKDKNILQLNAGQYWNTDCKDTNDPLEDLLSAIDEQKQNGWQTARILMNTSTFKDMCKSESLTKAIAPLGGVVRRTQVQELVQDETRCEIMVYDNHVVNGLGETVNVIPDGKVCLLPEGELGKMCFAATPEAYNANLGKTEPRKDIAVMKNGVTILTRADDNPVDYETIVSATMLPSFKMMDAVYVLNVHAAA